MHCVRVTLQYYARSQSLFYICVSNIDISTRVSTSRLHAVSVDFVDGPR